ncbi:hypothetical protein [Granulibacter bethesdensis]|uniref:hypothetical protein n=1 Tax=Granulibacter bethesdensis TaxID=364410 RepID=UPI0020A3550D|nr:hypothetical protein [Granulibacter bethesdensis]
MAGNDKGPGSSTEGRGSGTTRDSSSTADFARDWVDLWQSELSARASDPDSLSAWQALAQNWSTLAAQSMETMQAALKASQEHGYHQGQGKAGAEESGSQQSRPAGQAGAATPDAPQRPSPARAASDPRDDALRFLLGRVAELEERLARLENAPCGGDDRKVAAKPRGGKAPSRGRGGAN